MVTLALHPILACVKESTCAAAFLGLSFLSPSFQKQEGKGTESLKLSEKNN